MFREYFSGIYKNRFILISLVNRDLIQKYRRSILGIAWSIITPLGLAIIIGTIYSLLFNTEPKTLIPLLFAGINPWNFLSGCAEGGTSAFISAEGYIKQSTVSSQIFPLRTVATNMVNLLYSILTFFVIYLFLEPDLFSAKMLMVIPGLIIIFIFSWGMANITSIITLSLRDFQPFQSLILQGFFYITPIIYPVEMLREKGSSIIVDSNPFYYLLEVVRSPMIGKELPSLHIYLIAITISMCVFLFSVILYMKNRDTISYKL